MVKMRGQISPVRWDRWMVILVSTDLTDCLLSHVVITKLGTVRGAPQPVQIAQQFAVPHVWAKRTGGPFLV
jgi:hypothetical protein